jgi:hypothetical protein
MLFLIAGYLAFKKKKYNQNRSILEIIAVNIITFDSLILIDNSQIKDLLTLCEFSFKSKMEFNLQSK